VLYSKTGKQSIAQQVLSFTLNNGALTILTEDLRIYSANVKTCCDVGSRGFLRVQDTLEDVFETSREIQRVVQQISFQEKALDQLRLFSKLAEKTELFAPTITVKHDTLRPFQPPTLQIQLKLISEEVSIEDGFFALSVSIATKRRNFQKNHKIKQMRFMESFYCDMSVPSLDIEDFPLKLTANLVLLNQKILGSSDFVFSGCVLEHEISPFSFLARRQEPVSCVKSFSDGSEQTRFFALLDQTDVSSDESRRTKKKMKIDSQRLENNPCAVLCAVISKPNKATLFHFLNKEIVLECKDAQGNSENRFETVLVTAERAMVSVMAEHVRKYYGFR